MFYIFLLFDYFLIFYNKPRGVSILRMIQIVWWPWSLVAVVGERLTSIAVCSVMATNMGEGKRSSNFLVVPQYELKTDTPVNQWAYESTQRHLGMIGEYSDLNVVDWKHRGWVEQSEKRNVKGNISIKEVNKLFFYFFFFCTDGQCRCDMFYVHWCFYNKRVFIVLGCVIRCQW